MYRIPWYMQVNWRGAWLRRHGHKRPQSLLDKIIWTGAVLQGRWVGKRRLYGRKHYG